MPGDVRIGVSGWTYAPWRGAFYPKGLRQRDELSYLATHFNSVELNGSFYGLQVPASFHAWSKAVPDDFIFSIKGSRFITHMKRLTDVETPLANFLASGVLALGDKLGPLLWQLPPNFRFDAQRIESFAKLLPKTTDAARALAKRHDHRLRAEADYGPKAERELRHVIEIRHESFVTTAFTDVLKAHGIGLVVADTVKWPLLMDLTAGHVYCRLHGNAELYRSSYSDAELDTWAARLRAWTSGKAMTDGRFIAEAVRDGRKRDVFVYFDNTDKLAAPGNASALMERLGVKAATVPMVPEEEPALSAP